MIEEKRFNVEEHPTLDGRVIDVFPISHRYIHDLEQQVEKLQEENKQLKDNWNKLREVIRKKQDYYRYVKDNRYRKFLSELLDKMQEIEGSDE